MKVTFYTKPSRDLTVYRDIDKMTSTRFTFILHKQKVTISVRKRHNVLIGVEN